MLDDSAADTRALRRRRSLFGSIGAAALTVGGAVVLACLILIVEEDFLGLLGLSDRVLLLGAAVVVAGSAALLAANLLDARSAQRPLDLRDMGAGFGVVVLSGRVSHQHGIAAAVVYGIAGALLIAVIVARIVLRFRRRGEHAWEREYAPAQAVPTDVAAAAFDERRRQVTPASWRPRSH